MFKGYIDDLKNEFCGYNKNSLMKDILAGLTVGAVALPLALAFGVSSGANGAAGLITAIIAGLLIGGLSGASYQISGPTGAMSAILIGLSTTYGLQGVFIASLLSGILLLIAGIFKFGKIISFIPASVITGFTSGIAITIASGQIDNFFGVTSLGNNPIEKMISYFNIGFPIQYQTMFFGLLVVFLMMLWPKKWSKILPSSLLGIMISLLINMSGNFNVMEVGAIPSTLFPEIRLDISQINIETINQFLMPAISIAALGMIESLLCGVSGGKMKGEKLNSERELVAQGLGNIIIPFFGGVPATAAIARTSVAIKAGGKTRLVSIFHSLFLLLSMFILGPFMSKIPLAALAGVLIVTAWRMNEWHAIKFMFSHKIKTSIFQFLITMLATIIFDLTVAIILGVIFSMLMFVLKNSKLNIESSVVKQERLTMQLVNNHDESIVLYLSGPLFFGNQEQLSNKVETLLPTTKAFIISMRGVPNIDDSGVKELMNLYDMCLKEDIKIIFCGIQKEVLEQMKREDFLDYVGPENITWDSIMAIKYLDSIQSI
ncbi:MAG: SulP family inorganic anion transporter [Erysipelotrichaceae bacterium]